MDNIISLVQNAAEAYAASGVIGIPASLTEKRPLVGKEWPKKAAAIKSVEDVRALPWQNATALAVVTGSVSGRDADQALFMMDFDDKAAAFADWRARVPAELFARFVIETTQHGGRHVYWRSKAAKGLRNDKYAYAPDGKQVWIECRCEGGISIAAPTPGYERVQGDLAHVPTLTEDEHRALIAAAIALDKAPPMPERMPPKNAGKTAASDDLRPGDDWNQRCRGNASLFARLLEKHGWAHVGTSGKNALWRRPGKDDTGHSATWDGATFYVFSTNAAPFAAGRGCSAFEVYATLEHAGDYSAAARALAAAGYGEQRAHVCEVLSAEDVADVRRDKVADPGELPEALCRAEGWIGELTDYTLETAPVPNVHLAFAGALSACAHVAGLGRFSDGQDVRPNLYLLALADSGSGKNAPRKTNKQLAEALGESVTVIDTFGSGQGLEDCFTDSRCILANVDEIHKQFAELKDQKNAAQAARMTSTMLQLYSESDQLHTFRRLAKSRANDAAKRPRSVAEPHLSIFATGIPALTFASLSQEAMVDGLAARCILIEAGERGCYGNPHRAELPARVVEDARHVCEAGLIIDASATPGTLGSPHIVSESDEARELRDELKTEAMRLINGCGADVRGAADCSLYARVYEKASKLALVLAVSANMREPRIEKRHLEQGWDIARLTTERMRYLAARYLFESDFDALVKRALRFLEDYGKPVERYKFIRALHVSARDFDSLIETLEETHQVAEVPGTRKGSIRYKLV